MGRVRDSPAPAAGLTFVFPALDNRRSHESGTTADSTSSTPARDQQLGRQLSRHRRIFERKTDQQRQKQLSRQGSTSRSQNHIAKYLRARLTPEDDAPGRRSLDSFGERLRRRQHKQQQQQQQRDEQKHINIQSIGLPVITSAAEMSHSEFGALPETVQRKYFTSAERLHFTQDPVPELDHLDPLWSCPVNVSSSASSFDPPSPSCPPTPPSRPDSQAARHHRLASDLVARGIAPDSFFRPGAITPEFYAHLPDKIQRRHLTNEEQDLVVKYRRKRLVLDPSDELLYAKLLARLSAAGLDGPLPSPTSSRGVDDLDLPPRPRSADSMATARLATSSLLDGDRPSKSSIHDSFRWLDDDEELDLRLYLDDYHANLRDELPLNSKARRPSFRRRMSVSRLPFGQSPHFAIQVPPYDSSSLLPTNDVFASPLPSPSLPPSPRPPPTPTRPAMQQLPPHRRSRTLSLIAPRQSPPAPPPSIDGPAAHYQDPDARLKLRAFLASPQSFDEAVEFGFPSTDMTASRPNTNGRSGSRYQKRHEYAALQTFLVDDKSSVYSDDGSDPDSEPPKTPLVVEDPPKPTLLSRSARAATDSFMFGPVPNPSSREMTLRMTLTRPDLRADETQMYGWQQPALPRKSQSPPIRDGPTSSHSTGEPTAKDLIQRKLDAIDLECQSDDRGVIRRIWKKVRRQQQ